VSRSYAIIGTGAIGGFYGAQLSRAGFDVHFLARSDADFIRSNGLFVESTDGNFNIPHVNVYQNARSMPRCDVVAIALKSTANNILPDVLPWVVKKNGVVLVLQNGLGAEEEVAQIIKDTSVLGVLCFVCASKTGPGRIKHLAFGHVTIGQFTSNGRPSGITSVMRDISTDFSKAGIVSENLPDLGAARWKKLVWNVPYSGLSVMLSATTEAINANPHSRQLAHDMMREVCMAAAACGHSLEQPVPDMMVNYTDTMPPYAPSMKLDYDAKRPMEVESIFGNPLRAAQNAGVQVPRLEMLYRELAFLDKMNRKQ
jgi:2-dehydropantoate 2-reductase